MSGMLITMRNLAALALSAVLTASLPRAQTVELAKLTASDGTAGGFLGGSAALSGDRALIGAPFESNGVTSSGAAYVYERSDGGAWIEVAKLIASDGSAGDVFGYSVALSGDHALVGAFGDDDFGTSSGCAYAFERADSGAWLEIAKLTASDGAAFQFFGHAVALSGDRALVGAWGDDDLGPFSGSVFVFERDGGGPWIEVAKLTASAGQPDETFGFSVALLGDRGLIGAPFRNTLTPPISSAYVFERDDGGSWLEIAKLTGSDGEAGDGLGLSVSLSADRAVVGAPDDDGVVQGIGAAYVFEPDGLGGWQETAKLTASDGTGLDLFGRSVSAAGDRILIGSVQDDDLGSDSGAAYVFERDDGGAWLEVAKLLTSDGESGDNFGWSAWLARDRGLIGATGDDELGASSGSAYLFDLEPLSGGEVSRLSVSAGGTQPLEVDAGHLHAGETYLVLGSMSGTAPEIALAGGLTLPLNPDRYFSRTLHAPNRPPLRNSSGILNAAGHADASFTLVPVDLNLAGVTLHHAFVTLDSGRMPTFASNALALELVE